MSAPAGWRVMRAEPWRDGDRWEIYGPDGSGGIVCEYDIKCPTVRGLLDALAAAPEPPADAEIARLREALEALRVEARNAAYAGRTLSTALVANTVRAALAPPEVKP